MPRSETQAGSQGATVVMGNLAVDGADRGALRMDVTDPVSVDAAISAIVESHGRIDALVNSAGIVRTKPFLDMSLDEFDTSCPHGFTPCLGAAPNLALMQLSGHLRKGPRVVGLGAIGLVPTSLSPLTRSNLIWRRLTKWRTAVGMKDGFYVNLGIGIPMWVANRISYDISIQLQS